MDPGWQSLPRGRVERCTWVSPQLDRAVRRLSALAYKHEPPPVGAEVEYAVALRHMREAPEARYSMPLCTARYKWLGGRLCWDDFQFSNVPCGISEDERDVLGWTRLPDATTVPEMGAEVSWEVAKRDMMQRREARYAMRFASGISEGVEYAWDTANNALICSVYGSWGVSGFSEDNLSESVARWVRLA